MALTFGPPPSPSDPAPSWAPNAAPREPWSARPPAQVAVFAAMSLAIVLVCTSVEQTAYAVGGIAALAVGVALGLATPAARVVRDIPGLVAALLAMVATGLLLILAAAIGVGILPPVLVVLAGLVALGLDWRQGSRLRTTTFASGPFVVVAVSVEQGWALPAAVLWLVTAIVALWLLQDDERRATPRPAPLVAGPGDGPIPPLDLLRTLGLALLIGLAGAFLLGRPSCTSPQPDANRLPNLPYDRLPNGDPSGDPSNSERPAEPGEVPPEYRGDPAGGRPSGSDGPGGAGELEVQVDEQGDRYVEDPETGERYSVDEEGGSQVIRDEDGQVVGEVDDDGVVARDGAGTEQRYRTDGDGRLFVEGPGGERYYLEEGRDGTAVLRDEDGDVVASQDPGDADDHLVIRDPDGNVLVPDPDGDGEIPIPNRGVREGLPGWRGDTEYRTDDGTVVATDPDGRTRTYDTDWLGRERVRVSEPGEDDRIFVYDDAGPYPEVLEFDEDGRFVKRYRYDPQGVMVDTEPGADVRTYGEGEAPTGDGSGGSFDGADPDQDQADDEGSDDDSKPNLVPWLLGGLGVLLVGGLAAWLWSRRKPAEGAVERTLAEAIVVRIEEAGAARGRPRRRAETIVAYTRSLAEGPLPDPRLPAIGSLLSQTLFGGAPPSVDDLTRADGAVTEMLEAHPEPTRADRRQADKDARARTKAPTP